MTFSDLDLNSISLSPAESPLLRKQGLFYFASLGMREELNFWHCLSGSCMQMEHNVLHSYPLPSFQSDHHQLSYSDLPAYSLKILQAEYVPLWQF